MEAIVLKDPTLSPSKKVLETVLGKAYPAYDELINAITSKNYDLTIEWKYYNDGKTWLCKVQYKKKTICWISVWDQYFKTAFYFTNKTSPGIAVLDIAEEIKTNFSSAKPIGKLIPLVVDVNQKKQVKDLLKIIEYKKGLK